MGVVIIGIDPSSKKIAATITTNGSNPEVWVRTLPDPAPIDLKCYWADRWMLSIVSKHVKKGHEVYVFIEEPVLGRGGARSTIVQSQVRGAMCAAARRANAKEVHGVNNQRWKSQVMGKGPHKKEKSKRHIHKHWPVVYDMSRLINEGRHLQDLCDAACINILGQNIVKMTKRIEQAKESDEAK